MNTEYERGIYVKTPHRHNGYYAGDFSDRPFPIPPPKGQVTVRVPLPGGRPW